MMALMLLLQLFSISHKTPILIQKRHPYTGDLNPEMSGDNTNAFLHCRDFSGIITTVDINPTLRNLATIGV